MRFFIDTEFNDYKGELLSIALVAEHGAREFYQVLEHDESKLTDWVKQNVVPVLYGAPRPWPSAQRMLESFLSRYDDVEIVADYPADIEYFCHFMLIGPGRHINVIPRITFVLDSRLSSQNSAIRHNALADARAIKRHAKLIGV